MKRTIAYLTMAFGALWIAAGFVSCVPQQQANVPQEQQPQVDSTEIKQQVKMYLSLGWTNYKNKDYKSAIKNFKKVLELDPQNEKAYKFLSDSYLRMEDTTYIDTALAMYNTAIEKFPNTGYYYAGRGYIYQKLGDRFDELAQNTQDTTLAAQYEAKADSFEDLAMKDFYKATSLDSTDAASAAALGTIWLRRGKLDSAMVWLEKSVRADPEQVAIWKILAKLYVARNMYEKAAEAYEHLAKLEPSEPEHELKHGQYLAKSGKFSEAVEILQKYIEKNPQDYRGYQYMGLALAADGKYKEALEQLKKAEKINPNSVKLMCDIASTYIDMKKYSLAQRYINKAKKIDPSYGYIYIVEGDIYQQKAMDKVPPSGEVNMEIKCMFLKATKIYKKALRDPNWAGIAKSKINYLKPYLPTKEEIAAYKFIEGKSCGE